MRTTEQNTAIAVIGSGFSGTMAAWHLAARLPPGHTVKLFERAPRFAEGIAYASENPEHLLNVPASRMSAFPDRPEHFVAWLNRTGALPGGEGAGAAFVQRGLYGAYLGAILAELPPRRVARLRTEVVDLRHEGGSFHLVCGDGSTHEAAQVVLALGNLPATPWAGAVLDGLDHTVDPSLPVLILGTGLTMMDVALALKRQGFRGPIIAMSRRGLASLRHAPSREWPTPAWAGADCSSAAKLLHRMRQEIADAAAQGVDWRGVFNSLRPITNRLWQGMAEAERRRLLRHLRPWWDTHRHRVPGQVADAIAAMREAGQLRIQGGRIIRVRRHADHLAVSFTHRGDGRVQRMRVRRLIDATGADAVGRGGDTLVDRLMATGLVRRGPAGLGLDVTPLLQIVNAAGEVEAGLWALGPIVRGVFWEGTAVPEIRVQASEVAESLAASLAGAL